MAPTLILILIVIGVMFLVHPVAALVAVVATLLGLLTMKWSVAAAFEGWAGLEFLGSWIGSRRRKRGVAGLAWFCATCRSLNPSTATACYRGCGPRATTEMVGTYALPVEPSAGRSQRDRPRG